MKLKLNASPSLFHACEDAQYVNHEYGSNPFINAFILANFRPDFIFIFSLFFPNSNCPLRETFFVMNYERGAIDPPGKFWQGCFVIIALLFHTVLL